MRFLFDHHFSPKHVATLSLYDIPAFSLKAELPDKIKDQQWIPQLKGTDWVIVTCDRHIQTRKAEARALQASGASAIFISPFFANLPLIKQGEWLLKTWPKIAARVESAPHPFYYQIQQNGKIEAVKL